VDKSFYKPGEQSGQQTEMVTITYKYARILDWIITSSACCNSQLTDVNKSSTILRKLYLIVRRFMNDSAMSLQKQNHTPFSRSSSLYIQTSQGKSIATCMQYVKLVLLS